MNPSLPLPLGFRAHVTNVGVKDTTDDFTVVAADAVCSAAGVFTRSSFAGPSVLVSRRHVADGRARAMVVVSKNANVATGPQGLADAEELAAGVAAALGCDASDVLVASTGVIGRAYPMDRIRAGLRAIPSPLPGTDAGAVARGIMTTDTVPKTASAAAGAARVVGVAKGVGMIEPDMATMIAMLFTDALVEAADLDAMFRRVVDRTFNCVSVDTDTSTSDTAVVLASGAAGQVDAAALEAALYDVCASLTRQIARDGEGATKLLEVAVDGAADARQAKHVAKAIVNSPLVKTAVHGADPNWGRVAMAVGKSTTADAVDQAKVVIRFGRQEVYPAAVDDAGLDALAAYMRGDEVRIHVSLGTGGTGAATVWGCDLSDGYVRINADYTT
ncbi:MAG: bifunctional glutamate N-acetyltransferase/amino-acid acetyltransferase ArgJ [Ilumatobacteraceae bacterium]|nr:bifunctional glutamate N-acetyltransferase/amino-acid acetyltransferase ArgJ [Ilumatobacter sp.]MCB9379568.1 bifunctional glutamate N-acetyltransferase/amino-acid acetyltransferase ArgJ [Acidimicrobiaceae bacterium]MCO5331500.1 bifunctional glutamate N-acetyltransferase/amino-acid acetyltransferase ArgJ [Ilumatobacteraceae bacterium]